MHKVNALVIVCAGLLILALSAPFAAAAGVSISWKNACWGEDAAAPNLTWACNSNTNDDIRMTCSFKVDAAMPDFVGVGVYLDGMTEAAAVPDWWKLGGVSSGDCRAGLISLSADGSVLQYGGTDICFDPWQGLGGGGIGLYSWDDNRMHVNAVWALPEPIPLEAEGEYFAVQFRVSAARTVSDCAGCLIPMLWTLTRLDVCTATTVLPLEQTYRGGNGCLTWQSSTLPCRLIIPDPARNATWGQIKGLYR